MGSVRGALYFILFCKALGTNVVYCRLDEARVESVSLAIALAVVGLSLIVVNVRLEFS